MHATASHTHTRANLKSLQILRAIAATSVVYFHIGALPMFGSFGVDIFFVISGFVMALIISNGQSTRTFAISRLTRIIPLYWILTTCILLLATVAPDLLNSTTGNLVNYLKSLFFIPYFKENGELMPMLAVGWTLNYEMLFYFCIWLSLVLSRKFYLPLTVLLLTSAFIGFGKYSENQVASAFFGSSLIFEFLLGMLAFDIYRRNMFQRLNKYFLIILAIASYCALAIAETTHQVNIRILSYGIPSLLLVLSMTSLETKIFTNENLLIRMLTTVGDGSYATYLCHLYVVEGIRKIAFQKLHLINPYNPIGVTVIILFSLLAGHLLYKLLDKPLSKYFKDRFLASKPSRAIEQKQPAQEKQFFS